MKPTLINIAILLLLPYCLWAQISPIEDSHLHYRIVSFKTAQPSLYKTSYIEIANGYFEAEADFKKHIIITSPATLPHTIITVPAFGAAYTWRVVCTQKQKNGRLYHFSTLSNESVDTSLHRMRITQPAKKYTDGYVFVDGTRTLYNMEGAPVWFLPPLQGITNDKGVFRDLKITAQGTITFINDAKIFEINWEGKLLWMPKDSVTINGDSTENYHHEFKRLANGHYMTMGNEPVKLLLDPVKHKTPSKTTLDIQTPAGGARPPKPRPTRALFGTLIEYDSLGKVVWSWRSYPYFKTTIFSNDLPAQKPIDVHANAFCFDEKKGLIYVSFKNISLLLKIRYPNGEVLGAYGKGYRMGKFDRTDALFCEQHGCKISANGGIYLFNNNMCHPELPYNIVELQMDSNNKDSLWVSWKYDPIVNISSLKNGTRPPVSSGGNVMELNNQDLFVSACIPYSDVFIVNRKKEILWSATLEEWDNNAHQWQPAPQYRASMVLSRNE